MKKTLFAVQLVLLTVCTASAAGSGKEEIMYVWVDNVNVRSVPDISKKPVYRLKEGEKVRLTGRKGGVKSKAVLRGFEYNASFLEIIGSNGEKGWVYAAALTPYPLVAGKFRFKWKQEIGLTTFRSSIKFSGNSVYVGSNGRKRDSLNDASDGVYILDSATGKIKMHIMDKTPGDNDVNGIGLAGGRLYFGNDEGRLFCFTADGKKKIWNFVADGDIEGCPMLTDLNGDGVKDAVVATENNSVYALNGKNGKLLWNYNDRVVSEYDASGFLASPACADLDRDGTGDVIIGSRNGILYAFSGRSGRVIWKIGYPGDETVSIDSGIHSSAFIGNGIIAVAESYSVIHFFDFDGLYAGAIELTNPEDGIEGLFASPVLYEDFVYIGTSWWGNEDNFWAVSGRTRKYERTGIVSATCIVADILGNGSMQVICSTEKGEFLVFDKEGFLLDWLKLPAGVEATPFVQDIDGDGKIEILVACLDGNIYCYGTGSSGRIHYGQFRGNIFNTGEVPGNYSPF